MQFTIVIRSQMYYTNVLYKCDTPLHKCKGGTPCGGLEGGRGCGCPAPEHALRGERYGARRWEPPNSPVPEPRRGCAGCGHPDPRPHGSPPQGGTPLLLPRFYYFVEPKTPPYSPMTLEYRTGGCMNNF